MAKIPESTIDEVLSKADIESVVGKYVSFTKKTGQNLFGLCPFHSEKTPSFSVNIFLTSIIRYFSAFFNDFEAFFYLIYIYVVVLSDYVW